MKVVLIGNPNVGKSVIFGHLTGQYAMVSNYPGTTVEISRGRGNLFGKKVEVIDAPGLNSLVPSSEDEKVASDILINERPDLVVQVGDAKNLRRTLLLTLELKSIGVPLLLNLNIMDEAEQRRIKIDIKKLEKILGITVIPTVATEGIGIGELRQAVFESISQSLKPSVEPFQETPREKKERHKRAETIYDETVQKTLRKTVFLERLGDLTMNSWFGFPILFLVLYLMYKFVGEFAAQTGVEFLEETVFGKYVNPWSIAAVKFLVPIKFIQEFLVGEYGVMTMALPYAFAIILPILSAFFIFFSILEDSGYLPRLAILLNRSFRFIGLSGKAVIPMVLGLGCDTMATMTTRTLETTREKVIATLLLALAIPCSAQLGVILGMVGAVSGRATLVWLTSVIFIFLLVGFLAAKIIPGKSSDFVLEVPPLRIPKFSNILVKTLARIEWYLKEAVPLFILGTALLFFLDKLKLLKMLENLASPVVVNLLNLPPRAAEAFLIGFLRRDYGAAGLFSLQKQGLLDPIQVAVSLVTITLFVPCVAQFLVMIKERGMKTALLIVAFIFPFAIAAGGVVNFILRYFKVVL